MLSHAGHVLVIARHDISSASHTAVRSMLKNGVGYIPRYVGRICSSRHMD